MGVPALDGSPSVILAPQLPQPTVAMFTGMVVHNCYLVRISASMPCEVAAPCGLQGTTGYVVLHAQEIEAASAA